MISASPSTEVAVAHGASVPVRTMTISTPPPPHGGAGPPSFLMREPDAHRSRQRVVVDQRRARGLIVSRILSPSTRISSPAHAGRSTPARPCRRRGSQAGHASVLAHATGREQARQCHGQHDLPLPHAPSSFGGPLVRPCGTTISSAAEQSRNPRPAPRLGSGGKPCRRNGLYGHGAHLAGRRGSSCASVKTASNRARSAACCR